MGMKLLLFPFRFRVATKMRAGEHPLGTPTKQKEKDTRNQPIERAEKAQLGVKAATQIRCHNMSDKKTEAASAVPGADNNNKEKQ